MTGNLIECPHCGRAFELTEALSGKLREHLKSELESEISRREEEVGRKLNALQGEKAALAKEREAIDDEIAKGLREQLKEERVKAEEKARESVGAELKEMEESLREKTNSVRELQDREVALRREKRELEESRAAMKLEMERRLDEERHRILDDAVRKAEERHRLKDLEKEQKIKDLTAMLNDARRKAEQGSMERQGEVLEADFEESLRRVFPEDRIEPVPKGVRGADILQQVRNHLGSDCGIIAWETKNTKAWGSDWIPKLKEDMIHVRAETAVIVSRVLPDDVRGFGLKEGVWACEPTYAVSLAMALRGQLLAVELERAASEGKSGKMEMLYRYLSGAEFRQRVEGIVEAFQSMEEQLAKERRVMEKHWSARQKQIERVVRNTVGMYGDMQGIIGGQLPDIAALELEGGSEGKPEAESES